MPYITRGRAPVWMTLSLLLTVPHLGCTGEMTGLLGTEADPGPSVELPPEAIAPAGATIPPDAFRVSFVNDPAGYYADYYGVIRENLTAAGEAWALHIQTAPHFSIEIAVNFAAMSGANASGTSSDAVESGQVDGLRVFYQGVAYEMVTGVDPNGAAFDATMAFDTDYLVNDAWFATNPAGNAAGLPSNKIDGYSTCLHEMGHIIAFNGWRDADNLLPAGADYQSAFDALLVSSGGHRYFVGPETSGLYGGSLPLTDDGYCHVGNEAPGPGSDLVGDIMHGPTWGLRRHISIYDVAMLQDMGIPTR